jgi:hypothetical protein
MWMERATPIASDKRGATYAAPDKVQEIGAVPSSDCAIKGKRY